MNNTDYDDTLEPVVWDNRFSLDLPEGWRDGSFYLLDGPIDLGIQHNIVVSFEDNVVDDELITYATRKIGEFSVGCNNYQEYNREAIRLDSGILGYCITYSWYPQQYREIYQRTMYVLNGPTAAILTASYSKESFHLHAQEVEDIFRSFALTEGVSDYGVR